MAGFTLYGARKRGMLDPINPQPTPVFRAAGLAPEPTGAPANPWDNAPQTTNVLGVHPDYQALLAARLAPYRAQLNAQHVQDLASRNAAGQRALINWGEPLRFGGPEGTLIGADFAQALGDPTAAALAAKNTQAGISTVARMREAHADTVRNLQNQLAAMGLLSSGSTGYQLGREQTAYARTQYDQRQQLIDFLAGVEQSYLQAEAARQAALQQQIQQTTDTLSRDPTLVDTPDRTLQISYVASQQAGRPIYTDGNGNYYDQSGIPQ